MNMSYDASNLTTPDIKWLGVRPSDLDRFNIPEQCRCARYDAVCVYVSVDVNVHARVCVCVCVCKQRIRHT